MKKLELKTLILVIGLVLLFGGIGLVSYGTIMYRLSSRVLVTDDLHQYILYELTDGNYTKFSQDVFSGSWMMIDIGSTEEVEITVTGSVSGQLYDATSDRFISKIVNFGSTETVSVEILNPSIVGSGKSALVNGSLVFQHNIEQYEIMHNIGLLSLIAGGVFLIGGIGLLAYGALSKQTSKPVISSSLSTVQIKRFCPRCGFENPTNSVFCQQCGQKLS